MERGSGGWHGPWFMFAVAVCPRSAHAVGCSVLEPSAWTTVEGLCRGGGPPGSERDGALLKFWGRQSLDWAYLMA